MFAFAVAFAVAFTFLLIVMTKSKQSSPLVVQTGDVFLTLKEGNPDAGYQVVKILAIDVTEPAIHHICIYAETLSTIPTSIDTSKLQPMIMHLPVDRNLLEGFSPVFVQNEEVQKHELEGYEVYKEAMRA